MRKNTITRRTFLTILIVIILGSCWSPAFTDSKTFEEIFALEDIIKLQHSKEGPKGISAFKIGRDQRIWIVTAGRPDKTEVRIYSPKGDLITVIRKKDISPIKDYPYILFTDVAFNQTYHAYILEGVSGKVAIVDSTGRFMKYFPKDDCAGVGGKIKIDKEGNVYIGNPCYQEIEDRCPKSRGFCLHKYDSKGKYIQSFFPFEKRLFELVSPPFGDVYFDFDQEGNIWCVHQMIYQIFKYSPEGRLLQGFTGKSSLYAPPTKLLSQKSQKARRAWWSSWTPIVNLLVLEPDLILLSLHTPSSFVVEIYDQEGNVLATDIQTNHALLGKDDEGLLYFLLNSTGKKESREYKIGKFSLNLSAVSKIERQ